MSDFLFELGVEEVPVSEIKSVMEQLKGKFQAKLKEIPVEFKGLETAATNRRFMIYIGSIDEKGSDIEEQVKGPGKTIAFDPEGEPTLALLKFIELHQVKLEDLIEIKTPKGLYVGLARKLEGKKTVDILKAIIPQILKELTFSKTMVWNKSRVPFVRPIKNLLALFDNRVIDFEFAGTKSSNQTRGHALLSENFIKVSSFKEYCELLYRNFVIISEDERKKKIVDEIVEVEEEFSIHIKPDNKILENYIYSNEYPVLFSGEFDSRYLELPAEIISTFMINEKKLLPVFDKDNKLANLFIGISNIPDENKHVVSGNERVIQATFEDARFFWEQDRKDDFFSLRESLKNVVFHEGLGTYYEKTERLVVLVDYLAKETHNQTLADDLMQAALHCKNDLVTRMVREFPSLQGIMGGLYIKETGQAEETWKAVYWHYEPKGVTEVRLEHTGGGLLSLADKIDSIVGFLHRGVQISSSRDPYGIRRDAAGIIKILKDFKLDIDISPLIDLAISQYLGSTLHKTDKAREELKDKVGDLFVSRIENIFKESLHFRYDIVNAVLGTTRTLPIYILYLKAFEISRIVKSDSLRHLVALHKRLKNIIKEAPTTEVIPEYFVDKEETILYDIFKQTLLKVEILISDFQYLDACTEILEMKPMIDNFFEKVLVMAEDPKLRENRLALLQSLDRLLLTVADFSLIIE